MSQKDMETARFHVEMTQFHMEKPRTSASIDSKVLVLSRCHLEMTCFHMEMSQRCLPLHRCACAPAQNNGDTNQNHMPATGSESALGRNRTSSSRHHMALLQILLDRSFVRLGLLCCGGGRVEFFEHFECVLFEIQPRGFRINDPKPFENVRLVSSFGRCWIRRFNSGAYS